MGCVMFFVRCDFLAMKTVKVKARSEEAALAKFDDLSIAELDPVPWRLTATTAEKDVYVESESGECLFLMTVEIDKLCAMVRQGEV